MSAKVAAERAQLIDWAIDLAGGNPFFLLELSAHCGGDNAAESLPSSMQIAIERKVDALSPSARLLVQACAVLAQNSTMPHLEAMLALPPHAMAVALHELESSGLIAPNDQRVMCRHDLIADVVVRGLGSALGSYLHRRCAMALTEELRSMSGASVAWDCVRHWEAAGENSRALELTSLIVDRLLSLGMPQEAAELCVRAERFCTTVEQNGDRLLKLSQAHRLLHNWDGVVRALEQRIDLTNGHRTRRSRYSDDELALLEAKWWRDYDGKVLRHAVARVADDRVPTIDRLRMAVLALVISDNRQQYASADQVAKLVESLPVRTPNEEVEQSRALVVYHSSLGDLDTAARAAAVVVNSERLHGRPTAALSKALRWLSIPLKLSNKVAQAQAALRESFDVAAELKLPHEMFEAASCSLDQAVDCEDFAAAREWLDTTNELRREIPVGRFRWASCAYLHARCYAMNNEFAAAREQLGRLPMPEGAPSWTRAQQSLIALQILLTMRLDSRGPKREMIRRLRRLHLRARRYGASDFEVGVLTAALMNLGEWKDASTIVNQYEVVRRTRLPRHSVLRQAIADLTNSSAAMTP
jgi:hypothetical protein